MEVWVVYNKDKQCVTGVYDTQQIIEAFFKHLVCEGPFELDLEKSERERYATLNVGKPCRGCDNELTKDDMSNSLYGTHYLLCRMCASKISV